MSTIFQSFLYYVRLTKRIATDYKQHKFRINSKNQFDYEKYELHTYMPLISNLKSGRELLGTISTSNINDHYFALINGFN